MTLAFTHGREMRHSKQSCDCLSAAVVHRGPWQSVGSIKVFQRDILRPMPRFNKPKGAAKPMAARGGSDVTMTPLAELVSMDPVPLGGVSTVGRVIYIFGHTGRNLVAGLGLAYVEACV